MESFEDFFSSNKAQFSTCEPPSGHEQRFMKRLQQRKRSHIIRVAISSAASVALITGLTALMALFYHFDSNDASMYGAFGDVEVYYSSLLQKKFEEVEHVVHTQKPEFTVEVAQIMKDFENANESLRIDFRKTQKKDYMVGMIVQCYQTQIDILSQIKETIEPSDAEM